MSDAVVASGVELRRGSIIALRPSDLTVPRGAVTAMVGPNGSGKSTLLNAIAGLMAPSQGSLTVLGSRPDEVRKRIAYVLQSTQVDESIPITVGEAVAMGRYSSLGLFGLFTSEDDALVDEALRRLDLHQLRDRHLHELSGGQRQRVFVAQGLAQDRDLLLLDEPQTALDAVSAQSISDVLAEERSLHRTVIIATHDLAAAAAADHVVLLAGAVVAQGPPEEVLVTDVLKRVYLAGLVEVEGGFMVDDPAHVTSEGSHVHLDRGERTHPH